MAISKLRIWITCSGVIACLLGLLLFTHPFLAEYQYRRLLESRGVVFSDHFNKHRVKVLFLSPSKLHRGSSCNFDDEDAKRIADNFPRLESLDVSCTAITDAGVQHLSQLRHLSSLCINNCDITDEGAVHIGGMKQLESLQAIGTRISDHGLLHLEGLVALKHLDLSRSRVTEEGALAIADALPELDAVRLHTPHIPSSTYDPCSVCGE